MADQTVSVALQANVAGFIASMHQAQQAVTSLTNAVADGMGDSASASDEAAAAAAHAAQQHQAAMGKITKAAGIAGAALVGFAAVSVKAFADYDAKMTQIQSLTKALPAQMKALEKSSMSFAKEFGVSASQAADAETELVKAGVSVTDIINGGLKGALTLASAGQLDVADATEIAASTMTQFGLAGSDVSHIADLLAAGADKALGSVGDLGMALKQSGLVASQTGLTLEETTGALSAFASAGLIGSDAGTSFKTMLQALTPQSTQAATAMEKIGLNAYDSQGKFIGLAAVAGQLQEGLGKLTQQQQAATLKVIFGTDAVRAAAVLYKNGASGIQQWTDAVDDQGFAAEQASGKMNNLNGDLTTLKAAVSNAFVGMGSEADGPLRTATQRVTDLIDAFNDLSPAVKGSVTLIAGSAGFALLAVAGITKVIKTVREARAAFQALALTGRQTALAFGAIGIVITAATAGLLYWSNQQAKAKQQVDDLTDSLDQQTGAFTANTRAAVFDALKKSGAIDDAKKLKVNLDDVTDAALGLPGAMQKVQDSIQIEPGAQAGNLLKSAGDLTKAISGQNKDVEKAVQNWKDADEAQGGLNQQTKDLDTQTQALTQSIQAQSAVTQDADAATTDWADNVAKSGQSFINVADNIDDAKLSLQGWIDQIKKQGKDEAEWNKNLLKIATEGGSQELLTQLSKLGPEGASYVKQLADGSKKNITDLNKTFKDANQSSADLTAGLRDLYATKPAPISLTVDDDNALATINALSTAAATADATMTVDADGKPATKELDGITTKIDESTGTITLLAGDGKAVTTLNNYTAKVDRSTGKVTITGTDAEGRKVVTSFTSWTDAQGAAVKVTADTSMAVGALNTLKAAFGQSTFHVGVSAIPGKAGGGDVTGGTPGKDSVLSLLMPGEHVLTTSDVDKMGGQSAVYRMRAMAQAGMLRFASGGAVPSKWHGKSLEYWEDRYASGTDYLRLKQAIANDRASLREKEKYGPKGKDGKQHQERYVLRGIDRRVANSQLRDDEQALRDADTARAFVKRYGSFAAAIKKRDTAQDKKDAASEAQRQAKADLASGRTDTIRDARRGNTQDAVTGGLDSALGVVDQLRDLASNKSLTAKQRKAMNDAAGNAEAQLTSLYKQADGIEAKLDKAKDHLADMQQISDAAASTLKGTFNLSDAYSAAGTMKTDKYGNTWYDESTKGYTGAAIKATASAQAATAQQFATSLSKLQSKLGSSPASSAIVQQALSIFASDPEQGLQFVDALNGMSTADLNSVKASYNTIASAGATAGQAASAADTAGGLSAANKAADDLAKSLDDVNQQLAGIGTTLTNAMLKPYGLKLDAKGNVVKRARGGWVGGSGGEDSTHLLADPSEFVVNKTAARANAPWLEAINAGRTLTSVGGFGGAGPITVTLPEIRVQNPFTGEYLLAKVETVAGGVVRAHEARQDAAAPYTGGGVR
ncbi:phage tail tape measure protein [Luteimicrobium sp. NPDC057192]|uniref:phage tail tape measure protein n=1 Tax=Luteimicrobium sp. NPDC057192 TaxID=3346042 RepID=UPI0036301332